MRISAKGITGIGAIAAAIAFAGCECSMGNNMAHPPPPPPPVTTTTTTTTAPASMANPPPAAPLPPSMRAKLEKKDGG